MGDVAKISFDVLDPPLKVLNQVEANVLVKSLHLLRAHHKAALTDFHGTFTIRLDNPLSFPLLAANLQRVVSPCPYGE